MQRYDSSSNSNVIRTVGTHALHSVMEAAVVGCTTERGTGNSTYNSWGCRAVAVLCVVVG